MGTEQSGAQRAGKPCCLRALGGDTSVLGAEGTMFSPPAFRGDAASGAAAAAPSGGAAGQAAAACSSGLRFVLQRFSFRTVLSTAGLKK